MTIKLKNICQVFTLLFLLASCGGRGGSIHSSEGDTLQFRYAKNIEWIDYDGYSTVRLLNPWKRDGLLHTYLLAASDAMLPGGVATDATRVRVPLTNLLLTSSSHCNLLCELGCLKQVGGVCDLRYMNIPQLQTGVRKGSVIDVGNGMNPDMERVALLHPDAILVLPFENGGYGLLEKLGIPLIECADYMEETPLGQAEWMRFYGRLVGCGGRADSLFCVVERNYLQLKAKADEAPLKPTLMCETKTASTWYVPGGGSTMGQLYVDAGADYLFSDYKQSGSVPLAFETVFDRGAHADVWLIKYNAPQEKSYRSLLEENGLYGRFKPFADRRIWGCNLAVKLFYEETPFHPDLLLRDLILIFHPDLLSGDTLRYFSKMRE